MEFNSLNFSNENEKYSREEIISDYLSSLYSVNHVYDASGKRDGLSIAYSVMCSIEKTDPSFELIAVTPDSKEDIAGNLGYLILQSSSTLDEMQQAGTISNATKDFVNKVRELSFEYDMDKNNSSGNLVCNILQVIDKGMNGVTFEMKAIGYEEDIEYYKENGEKYYPLVGENIAGNLSVLYGEICANTKSNDQNIGTTRR